MSERRSGSDKPVEVGGLDFRIPHRPNRVDRLIVCQQKHGIVKEQCEDRGDSNQREATMKAVRISCQVVNSRNIVVWNIIVQCYLFKRIKR